MDKRRGAYGTAEDAMTSKTVYAHVFSVSQSARQILHGLIRVVFCNVTKRPAMPCEGQEGVVMPHTRPDC